MTNEDSSEGGSSAWKGWVLGLVAMPVVYVLSVPPVVLIAVYDRKSSIPTASPTWLEWYMAPGDWMYENVPLAKRPMRAYGEWWFRMYTGKHVP